ncbi:hypothetical protein ABZ341_18355 [Streptomyces sp. NPDC006173]
MTGPTPPPAEVPDLVEPGPPPRRWEETPAEAALADRYWFDRDE